jgi:peptidoglycan/xylan/chitin deacetylase (PgdA/CDA1 family)
LKDNGCLPTFPTPGIIVDRYPRFICQLQAEGAEIAVHGYQHVDLGAIPLAQAIEQLEKAVRTFRRLGIETYGFRCPYLGYSDALFEALPEGLFSYGSNQAIQWDLPHLGENENGGVYFDTLDKFYKATASADTVCLPWERSNMVEIPVCTPDDLQLYDGFRLGGEGIANAWKQILHQTYQRGELFTLLFHPELAVSIEQPFLELLSEVGQLHPHVWIARLHEISEWWREKSRFRVEVTQVSSRLRIVFECSRRTTILARGVAIPLPMPAWDGAYHRLPPETLEVPAEPRPFLGLPADVPAEVKTFLQEQGYILDTSETARQCGIYLDNSDLEKLANPVQLVDEIESRNAPLIRFWRWPEGARSALSVTGDLDALSLMDYLARLFP